MMMPQAPTGTQPEPAHAHHHGPHPSWTGMPLAVLILSIPVAVLTGWLVWNAHPGGRMLATGFNAVVGIVGGLLIAVDRSGCATDRRFRRFIGLAVMLAAFNQTLILTPQGGGLVSTLLHGATGILAVIAVVRRFSRAGALSSLRSVTEALAVGLALTCVSWAVVFHTDAEPSQILPKLLVSTTVIGVAVTMVVRSRSMPLAMTATGMIGVILLDLGGRWWSLRNVGEVDASALSTPAQAPFWALIVIGLLWFSTNPPEGVTDVARVERRAQLILASILAASLLGLVLHVLTHPHVDVITWWLLGAAVLAIWVREVTRILQSHQLLLRLSGLARTDTLTGLPNLWSLDHRLREISGLTAGYVITMTLDVNRFKDVNDILGASRGDELLAALGRELATLPEPAEAFRVGGDEFVVVSLDGDLPELAGRASVLVGRAAAGLPGTARLELTSSLGVDVLTLRPDTTVEHLHASVTRSGHAMRKAKLDRVPVAMYDEVMSRAHARRLLVEHRLWENMEAIEVYFQPIISLARGQVVGAEALARWTDATAGVVSPGEFVVAAEDTGLIDTLGRHVLRRALCGAVESGLIAAGHSLSVNVSPLQLRHPVFLPGFLRELRSAGVPPHQVTLEVTESVLVQADDPAVATLTQARQEGVRIALDDFGTGYSSLSYLTRLPAQSIKIDRSLTRRFGQDKADAIATSIIDLARHLDLEIVVEGVETAAQQEWARVRGLDRVQGWLYSPAVGGPDLAAMLHRQHRITTP